MRNLIFLVYIIAWLALARYVNRTPFWLPRVVRVEELAFVPDQRPAGCMMVLFLAVGAMIGAGLPMAINDLVPHGPYQFHDQGLQDLGAMGRLAMLAGGLCGGYVGLRGSRVWTVLFVLGIGIYLVSGVAKWVVRGY